MKTVERFIHILATFGHKRYFHNCLTPTTPNFDVINLGVEMRPITFTNTLLKWRACDERTDKENRMSYIANQKPIIQGNLELHLFLLY